jgi:peroxiredoxin
MTLTRVPVSVVVLTFNEERNLAACLDSVKTWAARIFVVDPSDRITYVEIVPEIATEPNYDSALKALQEAAGA